jgi:hypothetical protein
VLLYCGGNALPYAINQYDTNVAPWEYAPTISYEMRLCRVQLSQNGYSLFKALVAEHSFMKINVTRIRTEQYQIPAGQTQYSALSVGAKKPSVLCIWFNDSRLLTASQKQSSLLQCQLGVNEAGDGERARPLGIIAPTSSLRVRCAGESYPKTSEQAISRTTDGYRSSGGSIQSDFQSYKDICQQYSTSHNEVQPLFNLPHFQSGGYEHFYINLRDDDSPLFGVQNEAVNAE